MPACVFVTSLCVCACERIFLCIFRGFPTRMVYLYYISCLRYTILTRNPRILFACAGLHSGAIPCEGECVHECVSLSGRPGCSIEAGVPYTVCVAGKTCVSSPPQALCQAMACVRVCVCVCVCVM